MAEVNQVPLSSITNLELFNEWLKLKDLIRKDCCSGLETYVLRNINQNTCTTSPNIREILMKFIKNVQQRWKTCNRDKSRFHSNNRAWLESVVEFERDNNIHKAGPSRSGRPQKKFEDCGTRAKQKKVEKLSSTSTVEQLSLATQISLRKAGKRAAAAIIQEVTLPTSPTRAQKYRRAFKSAESGKERPIPLTPNEGLALIINSKSSKSTYMAYRMAAKGCNANIYPSWNKILAAKQECYPAPSSLKISDIEAEVNLEDILHLTARRLCMLQEEVLNSIASTRLTLVCKWGLDGSSGQSNYRQLSCAEVNDSSIFIISFVPLQLRNSENNQNILWQNPVPSSTRFCRAIKFLFAKETTELTKKETEANQKKINNLKEYVYKGKFSVSFTLMLTMVDGKVCNSLTETKSTQSCYICNAKPLEMNDLKNISKKLARVENYSFGLSTLHSWIRFFECCLHVGYRLDIKSWQARGENRPKMELRKKLIIDGLRKELGILVDQPKPGYGSTNTGNTARIFFRNQKISSRITGVDEEIIKRFHVILQTISCGYEVHSEMFKIYTMETAEMFVEKYPWFYMPPSVHKVLMHGAEIIMDAIVPIGQLGEEAQEAKNKDFKFIREHRSRKDSSQHTNEDLMKYFLLSSDPIISNLSLRKKSAKNKLKLEVEVFSLLKSPDINTNIFGSDSSGSESE